MKKTEHFEIIARGIYENNMKHPGWILDFGTEAELDEKFSMLEFRVLEDDENMLLIRACRELSEVALFLFVVLHLGDGERLMDYPDCLHCNCVKIASMYEKKNADYGDSFSISVKKYGNIAALTRISDKYNRIKRLLNNEAKVKDESIKDTLLDLASYCIMFGMELANVVYDE